MPDMLLKQIHEMPLVAVLRGIQPENAVQISDILVGEGFRFLEVTANSPGWQESLQRIQNRHGTNIVLAAGTVLSEAHVIEAQQAGARAIVSPVVDEAVISCSRKLDLLSVPGCYTPTECWTALRAGAHLLKIFPADTLGVSFIKSIRAILPDDVRLCPTGGIHAGNMADYAAAGVFAMGMGSSLYRPEMTPEKIQVAARELVNAYSSI